MCKMVDARIQTTRIQISDNKNVQNPGNDLSKFWCTHFLHGLRVFRFWGHFLFTHLGRKYTKIQYVMGNITPILQEKYFIFLVCQCYLVFTYFLCLRSQNVAKQSVIKYELSMS